MIGTVLLIVLLLILVGALPSWPYSRGWGYYPSGGVSVVLIIVVILLLLGYI
jgi:hypothetical protein